MVILDKRYDDVIAINPDFGLRNLEASFGVYYLDLGALKLAFQFNLSAKRHFLDQAVFRREANNFRHQGFLVLCI